MTSLSSVLRLNAASCLMFGAAFLVWPGAIGVWLGAVPSWALMAVGSGLIVNGAHLLGAARRRQPIVPEVIWFSAGDLVWWLATLALIAGGIGITRPAGIAVAMGVATSVAGLGVAQLFALGRAASGLSATAHWRRIGRSWMGLPVWVKLWLTLLNLVFLAAPACLPWPQAGIVLLAYAATGPLLLAFAVWSGGLTRVMGLAHLIAWVPLLVRLLLRWPFLAAHGAAPFLVVLTGVVLLCLVLELWDLSRWARGDRAVIGLA